MHFAANDDDGMHRIFHGLLLAHNFVKNVTASFLSQSAGSEFSGRANALEMKMRKTHVNATSGVSSVQENGVNALLISRFIFSSTDHDA
jgi:hypothetical protein